MVVSRICVRAAGRVRACVYRRSVARSSDRFRTPFEGQLPNCHWSSGVSSTFHHLAVAVSLRGWIESPRLFRRDGLLLGMVLSTASLSGGLWELYCRETAQIVVILGSIAVEVN